MAGPSTSRSSRFHFTNSHLQETSNTNLHIRDNELQVKDAHNVLISEHKESGKAGPECRYCFTGTIERVIKWHRLLPNHFCFFEVIATMVAVKDGNVKLQRVLLLKDQKGPILQVIHYLTNPIQVEDFSMGQKLRCVGHMTGPNILTAISIRSATQEEIAALQRHCYIGDYAVSKVLAEEDALG